MHKLSNASLSIVMWWYGSIVAAMWLNSLKPFEKKTDKTDVITKITQIGHLHIGYYLEKTTEVHSAILGIILCHFMVPKFLNRWLKEVMNKVELLGYCFIYFSVLSFENLESII